MRQHATGWLTQELPSGTWLWMEDLIKLKQAIAISYQQRCYIITTISIAQSRVRILQLSKLQCLELWNSCLHMKLNATGKTILTLLENTPMQDWTSPTKMLKKASMSFQREMLIALCQVTLLPFKLSKMETVHQDRWLVLILVLHLQLWLLLQSKLQLLNSKFLMNKSNLELLSWQDRLKQMLKLLLSNNKRQNRKQPLKNNLLTNKSKCGRSKICLQPHSSQLQMLKLLLWSPNWMLCKPRLSWRSNKAGWSSITSAMLPLLFSFDHQFIYETYKIKNSQCKL